ncbi:helix-turn-helix domain-containing protein [Leclercia sp. UBA5958]|uniref:helix-turn-helix domain-containing protein n=1 Tax=Leclercia sp. UBA5958 TaxID=1946742 RepID=UPI0004FF8B12|nr:helix-turn-helix domain-containing protein [Leclercia sp. UBA5958]KGB02595.1 helix-turn-helix domain protein [Enterobacteriaceae bacterium ATCC 29904]
MKVLQSQEFFLSDRHAFCLFMLGKQNMEEVHGHDFDEIVIVSEGSGFHIINGSVEFIYKGDFFFVSVNDTHSYLSTNNLSVINVLIHKERSFFFLANIAKLIDILKENNSLRCTYDTSLSEEELDKILGFTQIINQLQDDEFDELYFSTAETAILGILDTLCRRARKKTLRQQAEACGRKYLINALKHNYLRHINWEGLCDESRMTKRTMFRFVKDVTGYTPAKFQLLFRLLKAQELLRTTDKTINEVAINCGFMNTVRFTETYKRQFRYTPSQERKLVR